MNEQFLKAPKASSVRLLDFKTAKVVPGFVSNTFILIVTGTKPYLNMTVELSPLIYIRQPALPSPSAGRRSAVSSSRR